MFGRKMLFGINASVLPASVTAALSTEEQLAEAVSSIRSIDAEVHVHDEETVAGVEAGSDDEDTDSRNQLRRAIKRNQSRAFAGLQSQAMHEGSQ